MDEDLLRGAEAQKANDNPVLTPDSGPPGSAQKDRKAFHLPENEAAQGALPVLDLDFGDDFGSGISVNRGGGAEAGAARKHGDVRPPVAGPAAPELDHHPIAGLMSDALSTLTGRDPNSDATTRLKQIAEQTLKASDVEGGNFELITSRNSAGNHQIVLLDARGNRAGMIARAGDFVAIDDGKDLTLVSLNGINEADGTIKFDKDGRPIFGAVKDDEPIPFKSAQAYADLANDLVQLSHRYGPTGQSDITSLKKQDEKEQKALSPIAAHLLNAGDELAAVSRKMFGTEQPPNRDKLEIGFREFRSMNADDFVARKAEAILDFPTEDLSDRHQNGEIRQALADHYLATGQYDKAGLHYQHLVDNAEQPADNNPDAQLQARNDANAKKLEMTKRAAAGRPPLLQELQGVIRQERPHFSSTDRFAPREPEI